MRKICVITGTRAEYGLLYFTLQAIKADPELHLQLCVTGMHLSPEFGLTYKQIEADGFSIDEKIDIELSSDSEVGISKSIALAIAGFAEAFDRLKPDLLLVLGDRFEIFGAVTAAQVARIPVAHCNGGETTEGAIDEAFRHSITKMSHLHFTATEEYKNRVIQLGEDPERVYNIGFLGIENINKLNLLSRGEFEKSIKFELGEVNFLVTYHPVTLDSASAESQFAELLRALDQFPEARVIFTKPNADTGGRVLIRMIDDFVQSSQGRAVSFVSLGQLRYLSALRHVHAVIGNSSSGLTEAPSFQTPTVNIGDRQSGRIKAASVIDCAPDASSVVTGIKLALSARFKSEMALTENPYGTGNPSESLVSILKNANLEGILKKKFYTIPNTAD